MNAPLFRPPAEADSLIIQVDQGCPHNRCTFCGMYKDMPFHSLALDEVRDLVEWECRRRPDARRVFLADGDVMHRPFKELLAILTMLNERLRRLARVSLYANGRSIVEKTPEELVMLRELKLSTLYMGLESGDEALLRRCGKSDRVEDMVRGAVAAQASGLRMSVMILLGLGGAEGSAEHARLTAAVLCRMQPRLLSALRVIPVPGTPFYDAIARRVFTPLTEREAVRELRDTIAALDLQSAVFRANHVSNVVPVEARLPRDKQRVLDELDALLASGTLDATSPGRTPMLL